MSANTHTHTKKKTRQEKEKAENLKKKMSVSGVGGSAANVAPAVSWSLTCFFHVSKAGILGKLGEHGKFRKLGDQNPGWVIFRR